VNRPVKVALNTVLDGVTKGAVSTPSRGPGRHTLDNILRAAGEILDEAGYEGFNTTAVAQRAGISTATLYRHYPDKHAVLRALIVHEQTERSAALGPFFEAFATAADWRTPLAEATRHIWRMRLAQPGGRATRRALQMSPDLWQWDQRQNEEIAQGFARAMRRPAGPGEPGSATWAQDREGGHRDACGLPGPLSGCGRVLMPDR
jgi:AcrR family transcriptional regulator